MEIYEESYEKSSSSEEFDLSDECNESKVHSMVDRALYFGNKKMQETEKMNEGQEVPKV